MPDKKPKRKEHQKSGTLRPFLQERQQPYQERRVGNRGTLQSFLIVCEGKRTEPNYFLSFDLQKDVIEMDVQGEGYNTLSLVRQTVELKKKQHYHQVWCVFDRDDFPKEDFVSAISLAASEGIRVAYSNQSFELWYVLHFDYLQAAIQRDQYIEILETRLGHKYTKNSQTVYQELKHLQSIAIRNAEKLLKEYTPSKPEDDCPSTTVHLLVRQLNRFPPGLKKRLSP